MLHDAKETILDEKKYKVERDKLEEELKAKEALIDYFISFE